MRRFLGQLKTDGSALSPELSTILDVGFVEEKGCVLLASKARGSASARAAAEDETGYECFINHLHVEDLGEALEFARRLNKALAEAFTGSLSLSWPMMAAKQLSDFIDFGRTKHG